MNKYIDLAKANKLITGLLATIAGLLYILFTLPTQVIYEDTPEAVMKTKNFFITNLDELEVHKKKLVKSKKTGKPLFGVWYKVEQENGNSTYIARFESVDNLQYNKKHFVGFEQPKKLLTP